MKLNFDEIQKKIKESISPADRKRGIISAVYTDSWTADVIIIGGLNNVAKNIPISLALGKNDVKVGDKCKLDMFDESNPTDMVVAYTYGRARRKNISGASYSSSPGTAMIAHGLGEIPDIVIINSPVDITASAGIDKNVYQYQVPDANYIYINNATNQTLTIFWYAALIQ